MAAIIIFSELNTKPNIEKQLKRDKLIIDPPSLAPGRLFCYYRYLAGNLKEGSLVSSRVEDFSLWPIMKSRQK
jgi:hypothetical protein